MFIYGDDYKKLILKAKQEEFAIPAVNATNSSVVVAALQAARELKSPICLQVSYKGAQFFSGTTHKDPILAAVVGAEAFAYFVHNLIKYYEEVPVVIGTDHATKEMTPWLDELYEHESAYFLKSGKPLFSQHMLDFSNQEFTENLSLSSSFLKKYSLINVYSEVEVGVTGNEEMKSGDNLYAKPEDISDMVKGLKKVSERFLIAAIFGNLHGTFADGEEKLKPEILTSANNILGEKVAYVFHGGSGSKHEQIKETFKLGVVKVNIDTDIQWQFWNGIKQYYELNKNYLQTQIGSPLGLKEPNKEYYDPRKWLASGIDKMQQEIMSYIKLFRSLNQA